MVMNVMMSTNDIRKCKEVFNLFKRYSLDNSQEEQIAIEMPRSIREYLLKRAHHVTHDLLNTQQSFINRFLTDNK
ncbi:unnamed protein product [Rotaria sp. Silwood2]|nr:unnamed protein product [Rotaria sp. Silwood2]CAF3078835.1 unnamed protein product [Rotaria sp. Silwood2]CAF4345183.1 unnamed protein product [Rotaria sp. Silwood2]CAF4438887.1 unnamed protein product [Rotaria sp. Silwood2]